jgi:hypothetical protein
MSEGTFENDGGEAEGQQSEGQGSEGLATGAGPTESGGGDHQNQGAGTAQGNSDVQDDIEGKAEAAKDSTNDQHLGDAMDDVDLEPKSS